MTRGAALALTFATGATGLVYQVTWQRYLAALLGSHGEATAAVLGLFLGGLAGGYALFGRATRRRIAASAPGHGPRLLALYGVVEAGVGVWALAFPLLFAAVRALSVWLPELPPAPSFAFDVALAALLLLPPTVLMGGTIPILTQALASSTEDATKVHARVYGINTAGAVLGSLLAGFWLISSLGFPNTLRAMAAVNLLAGLCFWWAGDAERPAASAPEESGARVGSLRLYLAAALLSGFAMMTLEVVAIRIGGLALGSSEYTFSVVVAVFVACIAGGSLLVGALPRVPAGLLLGSQVALVALLYWLYSSVPLAPYAAHRLRVVFTSEELAFYPYLGFVFLAAALCIAPIVLLSGATLPLIFDHLRRRYGDLGAAAGRLYAWNTLGSLLGALVGGYALLLWLDLHHVYRVAASALALGGSLLALARAATGRKGWAALAAIALAGGTIALWALPAWPPTHLASGLYRERGPIPGEERGAAHVHASQLRNTKFAYYGDDPSASVAVLEYDPEPGVMARALIVNGKPDSATFGDTATTVFLAVLPALLAEQPRRAFVAGLGKGVTAGELAELEGIEEVVVAEISEGVVEAAPLFDFASQGASDHPRVRITRSDAYRALLREPGRYQLIVSEPSNPWVTGVEMLYSREFLEAARGRLDEGGVYCQWMHQYETDAASVELVLRTFSSVFEQVSVWYGLGPDLLIVGFPEPQRPEVLLERIRGRAARPDFAAAIERAGMPGVAGLLAHELLPLGVIGAADLSGPLHRLEHPRLSQLAARAFFRGGAGELPFTGFGEPAAAGRDAALLPRYLASLDGPDREEAWRTAVDESCRSRNDVCTALLASWGNRAPEDPAFLAALQRARSSRLEYGSAVQTSSVSAAAGLAPGSLALEGEAAAEGVALADAERATSIYQSYYHHAVPFDPGQLLGVWEACRGPEEQCASGAARARDLLGATRP